MFVNKSYSPLQVTNLEKSMTAWQMLLFTAMFFGTYLLYSVFEGRLLHICNPEFYNMSQVKQIKCLKNKDINVTSTTENTGAFINIIPAKAAKVRN